MATSRKRKRLLDAYRFAGFRPLEGVRGVFGDSKARIITLVECGRTHLGWYDRTTRRVRDLSSGDTRVYLEFEVRRLQCRCCGKVKREKLDFLAETPFYTKRFAWFVGRRCRTSTIQDVAEERHLDWHAVKELDKQYRAAQLERAGVPGPKAIGIDEISIRKGHTYRIVVSDLIRHRPIWFGGEDRSEASMEQFYEWLGERKSHGIRLAVMDRWKPFRNVTARRAPQAAILFDKFHVMRHLNDALDKVRKAEYARLQGKDRRYIKGQKYVLLTSQENLSTDGRKALKTLLAANKRLNTAYLLKDPSASCGASSGKAGRGVSSTTARRASSGSASSLTRSSLRWSSVIGMGLPLIADPRTRSRLASSRASTTSSASSSAVRTDCATRSTCG